MSLHTRLASSLIEMRSCPPEGEAGTSGGAISGFGCETPNGPAAGVGSSTLAVTWGSTGAAGGANDASEDCLTCSGGSDAGTGSCDGDPGIKAENTNEKNHGSLQVASCLTGDSPQILVARGDEVKRLDS